MDKSLKLLEQIIQRAELDDLEYKKLMIQRHEASKSIGKGWMVFHLNKLKELIQRESDEKV